MISIANATSAGPASSSGLRTAELVSRILADRGRGPVSAVTSPVFLGRNEAWSMTLESGERVFVKKVTERIAGPRAYENSIAFDAFTGRNPEWDGRTPRLIAADRDESLLVFEHCPGTSMAHLLVDEKVPRDFAVRAGQLLAGLHSAPDEGLVASAPASPPVEMLTVGVPVTRYLDFTLAENALWSDLQRDRELIAAVTDLRNLEREHRTSPVHGDLRLDQFHIHDAHLFLLDWEEFGRGDPARDLGMLAGEWFYRAVLDTVTTRGGATAPPPSFDDDTATSRIAERMSSRVPFVREMWTSYSDKLRAVDPGLAVRATAHLGWHLVDRSIARAAQVAQLPGIERAAAGIGRRALINPAAFARSLGFERTTP